MRVLAVVLLAALPSAAEAASGTVNFGFTTFSGPYVRAAEADAQNPAAWGYRGLVNGNSAIPTFDHWAPTSAGSVTDGFSVGSQAISGAPNSVDLRYDYIQDGDSFINIISFAPSAFTNVAVGQDFKLGTLTFQNGGWYGAGNTAAFNTPTDLGFTLSTVSADGAQFNQTITGTIRLSVNSPFPNDLTTLGGQEAEADWISLYSSAATVQFQAFRVFDDCCKPAGFTNVGTVDVYAHFGSLDLVDFRNPSGGFLTDTNGVLPPVVTPPPGVPEPASWALLIAGFGLTGAVQRRRRSVLARPLSE
jgi:hypothetical protein